MSFLLHIRLSLSADFAPVIFPASITSKNPQHPLIARCLQPTAIVQQFCVNAFSFSLLQSGNACLFGSIITRTLSLRKLVEL